jgi:23S rRNA pseudouridine1911/1915/1917 synthase
VDRTRRFRVEGGDATRLDLLVARRLDLSRSQAATLIAGGGVLVDGHRQKASFKAEDGSEIVVELPEVSERTVEGENIPLSIVFED